jgi:hypothetical protein
VSEYCFVFMLMFGSASPSQWSGCTGIPSRTMIASSDADT